MIRYEKIHSRLALQMTFWDKIKHLLGYKIKISYCMKVLVSETDHKFEYMKVDSVEPTVALHWSDEPPLVDTQLKVAKLHEKD